MSGIIISDIFFEKIFCRFSIKVYVYSAVATNKIGIAIDNDYKGKEDDNSPNDFIYRNPAADGNSSLGHRESVVVSHRHP